MRFAFAILTALMMGLFGTEFAAAQLCPSAEQCRKVAPAGKLLYGPNKNGHNVWTTTCGPNTNGHAPDQICQAIASCSNAGAFGKFLQAVSNDCREKHFDGYFGLDGMTFGILDWTSSNLPGVLKAYQLRSPDGFAAQFDKLKLPMKNGCLDPGWTCRSNQQETLMCEPNFRASFSSALKTAEFRQAQMDYALAEYEKRLSRYASLGLKSEYGNTAIAVVANNLKRTEACKPSAWKDACKAKADEKSLVDCMLQQYLKNACRGTARASLSRVESIKAVFAKGGNSGIVHPTAPAIEQCVADWSK